MKPHILVTGPNKRLRFGWWATRFALRNLGLRVSYGTPGKKLDPERFDGVIVGGGDDIEPSLYGLLEPPAGRRYDPERDNYEIEILESALKRRLPLLGICRGAQLLNVVQGGTLYSNIKPLRKLTSNRRTLRAVKPIRVKHRSRLRRLLGLEEACVNSLHEQAIDKLGGNLQPVASDRDHFIQAVEDSNHPFMMGLQWHPEYLSHRQEQRNIFRGFADSVRANAVADTASEN